MDYVINNKRIFGFVPDNECIWFFDEESFLLNKLDVNSGQIRKMVLPDKKSWLIFSDGEKKEELLYFAPWNEPIILGYDECNNEIKTWNIRHKHSNMKSLFRKVIVANDEIFFIPFEYDNGLVILNTKNDVLRYETITDSYLDLYNSDEATPFFFDGCRIDNKIYMSCFSIGYICIFDIENNECTYNYIDSGDGFMTMIPEDKYLWILCRDGKMVYKYSIENNSIEMSIKLPICTSSNPFWNMIDCGDYLLCLQFENEQSVFIDKHTYKTESQRVVDENCPDLKKINLAKRISRDKIVFFFRESNRCFGIFDIATKTVKIRAIKGIVDGKMVRKFQEVSVEGEKAKLNDYLALVKGFQSTNVI